VAVFPALVLPVLSLVSLFGGVSPQREGFFGTGVGG
jgi:hypothetical protein